MNIASRSLEDTVRLATRLGLKLKGGEVIELVGDLGAGKTAFVRGLAQGVKSPDQAQSPTFTISRIYKGKKVEIHHFDFHRLEEPGVLAEQLQETLANPRAVTVIEWSQIVRNLLPRERLTIAITATGDESRQFKFVASGSKHATLIRGLA